MAIRISSRAVPAGETLIAASRQVWLASLGAAVVTGEWAQKEAAPLFRTLVKEGTISLEDLDLFTVVDTAKDVVDAIFKHYESRGFEPSAQEQEILLQL